MFEITIFLLCAVFTDISKSYHTSHIVHSVSHFPSHIVHTVSHHTGHVVHPGHFLPTDCGLISNGRSGVYTIYPDGYPHGLSVYCDQQTDDGGWIVIQRRFDGSVNFYRNWAPYRNGFGNIKKEFWLGNEKIHQLTKSGEYMLRVELQDKRGVRKFAEYNTFIVDNEASQYKLTIGGYCGTAGDALYYNNHFKFTTKDRDSTKGFNGRRCSLDRYGGFWFDHCTWGNPNGKWIPGRCAWDSVYWFQWKKTEGMARVSMKIRRK